MSQQDARFAKRFAVAFSFSGEHREYVKNLATLLAEKLGRDSVFYDEWFEHEILGHDMDLTLQRIYHDQSLMVVADLSQNYSDREWTNVEWRVIRALEMQREGVPKEVHRLRFLNLRFDDGNVPGVWVNTGYADARQKNPEEMAELILKRLALLTQSAGEAVSPTPTPNLKENSRLAKEPLSSRSLIQAFLSNDPLEALEALEIIGGTPSNEMIEEILTHSPDDIAIQACRQLLRRSPEHSADLIRQKLDGDNVSEALNAASFCVPEHGPFLGDELTKRLIHESSSSEEKRAIWIRSLGRMESQGDAGYAVEMQFIGDPEERRLGPQEA